MAKTRAICEADRLEILEKMKNFDLSQTGDEVVSKLKFLQAQLNVINDALDEKKKDRLGKLQAQLDAATKTNAELTAKLAEVPPDAAATIKGLETQVADLRQQLLTRTTPTVKEVFRPDPAVVAENGALRDAVAYFVKGWSSDMKVDALLDLCDENRPAAKVLAALFKVVRWEDLQSLLTKHSTELLSFANAYKSPLAPVAMAIRIRRQQAESQAQFDKNQEKPMILAAEATPIPPSPEEIAARAHIEAQYSPEVLAVRQRSVIEAAERAKEPHPEPTCDAIREIEANIAYAKNLQEQIKKNDAILARLRGETASEDI